MDILDRAGLTPRPFVDATPFEPDRFDLTAMRREQATRYLAAHRCTTRFGTPAIDYPKAAAWTRQILGDDEDAAPNLLIVGATGAGKSRLAWAVLSALKLGRAEQGRGLRCWMVGHADFNAQMRPAPGDGHLRLFDQYATADLLVLDDLAATRSTEWAEETLYRLVDGRWVGRLPTVVVTNLSTKRDKRAGESEPRSDLERAVGDRVASRVQDAVVIALTGADRRIADARTRREGDPR